MGNEPQLVFQATPEKYRQLLKHIEGNGSRPIGEYTLVRYPNGDVAIQQDRTILVDPKQLGGYAGRVAEEISWLRNL